MPQPHQVTTSPCHYSTTSPRPPQLLLPGTPLAVGPPSPLLPARYPASSHTQQSRRSPCVGGGRSSGSVLKWEHAQTSLFPLIFALKVLSCQITASCSRYQTLLGEVFFPGSDVVCLPYWGWRLQAHLCPCTGEVGAGGEGSLWSCSGRIPPGKISHPT